MVNGNYIYFHLQYDLTGDVDRREGAIAIWIFLFGAVGCFSAVSESITKMASQPNFLLPCYVNVQKATEVSKLTE